MHSKVDETVGVSPLVIIPRDDLVEGIVKRNAGSSINNTGAAVVDEILRHNSMVSVSKNSLHLLALRGGLKSGEKLILGASLVELNSKINHGYIRCWATNSHTGEDSVQFRDDLSDGLGGTSGRGDKVGNGGTEQLKD